MRADAQAAPITVSVNVNRRFIQRKIAKPLCVVYASKTRKVESFRIVTKTVEGTRGIWQIVW